jgi:hypothetical protein
MIILHVIVSTMKNHLYDWLLVTRRRELQRQCQINSFLMEKILVPLKALQKLFILFMLFRFLPWILNLISRRCGWYPEKYPQLRSNFHFLFASSRGGGEKVLLTFSYCSTSIIMRSWVFNVCHLSV